MTISMVQTSSTVCIVRTCCFDSSGNFQEREISSFAYDY